MEKTVDKAVLRKEIDELVSRRGEIDKKIAELKVELVEIGDIIKNRYAVIEGAAQVFYRNSGISDEKVRERFEILPWPVKPSMLFDWWNPDPDRRQEAYDAFDKMNITQFSRLSYWVADMGNYDITAVLLFKRLGNTADHKFQPALTANGLSPTMGAVVEGGNDEAAYLVFYEQYDFKHTDPRGGFVMVGLIVGESDYQRLFDLATKSPLMFKDFLIKVHEENSSNRWWSGRDHGYHINLNKFDEKERFEEEFEAGLKAGVPPYIFISVNGGEKVELHKFDH